jgi:hypothetical protein
MIRVIDVGVSLLYSLGRLRLGIGIGVKSLDGLAEF